MNLSMGEPKDNYVSHCELNNNVSSNVPDIKLLRDTQVKASFIHLHNDSVRPSRSSPLKWRGVFNVLASIHLPCSFTNSRGRIWHKFCYLCWLGAILWIYIATRDLYNKRQVMEFDEPWILKDHVEILDVNKDVLHQEVKKVKSTTVVFYPSIGLPLSRFNISDVKGQTLVLGSFGLDFHKLFPHERQIKPAVNTRSQCLVGNIHKILESLSPQVSTVLVVFEEELFQAFMDSASIGEILQCYISLLEAISELPADAIPDIYVHLVSTGSNVRSSSRFMSQQPQAGIPYSHFSDVFMKAVYLYGNVCKSLHNLNLFYIQH